MVVVVVSVLAEFVVVGLRRDGSLEEFGPRSLLRSLKDFECRMRIKKVEIVLTVLIFVKKTRFFSALVTNY